MQWLWSEMTLLRPYIKPNQFARYQPLQVHTQMQDSRPLRGYFEMVCQECPEYTKLGNAIQTPT